MTRKSWARKFYREYRKAGAPFILAHKLSKLRVRDSFLVRPRLEQALKVPVKTLVYCECCGPETFVFEYEGFQYKLGIWNGELLKGVRVS